MAFDAPVRGHFDQLPLEKVTGRGQRRKLLVEYIKGVAEGSLDKQDIVGKIREKAWTKLPTSIGFREDPAGMSHLELVAHKGEKAGELDVIKVMRFSGESDALTAKAKRFLNEDADIYQLAKMPEGMNPKVFMQVFSFLLARMGGVFVALRHTISAKPDQGAQGGVALAHGDRAAIEEFYRKAYAHIRQHCPKRNTENAIDIWVRTEIAFSDSPLFKWTRADVQDAIKKARDMRDYAERETYWPLFLGDLSPWFAYSVLPLLTNLRTTSIMILGGKGAAKSTLMRILGFAFSRHALRQRKRDPADAAMRVANNLDFFRNEEGDVCCPDGLDDVLLSDVRLDLLKGFLDMKLNRVNTYARWGSSTFHANQPRMLTDNVKMVFDAKWIFEPSEGATEEDRKGDLDKLITLLGKTFGDPAKVDWEDVKALWKRAHVILNANQYCYVMQAEDRPDTTGQIYRFNLREGYVSGAARAHLLAWSTNQTKRDGETETRLIAEEQRFLDEVFDREDTALASMRESASGAASAGALAFGGSNDPYRHLPRPGQGAPGSWPTKPLPPPVPLRAKPLLFADRNSAEMEMEDENIDAQLDACREFEEAQREREAIQAEETHRAAVAQAAQEEAVTTMSQSAQRVPGRFRHALAGSSTDIIEINTDDEDDRWLFCNREISLRIKEEPTDEGDEHAATGEK